MPSSDMASAAAPLASQSPAERPTTSQLGAWVLLAFLLIIAVNLGGGYWRVHGGPSAGPELAWIATLGLMGLVFGLLGRHRLDEPTASATQSMFTPYWLGLLVDQRNRVSMSRAQLAIWSLLIISAVITEGTLNVFLWHPGPVGDPGPLDLQIPASVWGLLGLSGASAIGAPLILIGKGGDAVAKKPKNTQTLLDAVHSDDAASADCLDLSKLQNLFLTLAVVLVYAIAIGKSIAEAGTADQSGALALARFPDLGAGFVALLGVSHATYLGYKGIPQKRVGPSGNGDTRGGGADGSKPSSQPPHETQGGAPHGPIVSTEPPPPAPGA